MFVAPLAGGILMKSVREGRIERDVVTASYTAERTANAVTATLIVLPAASCRRLHPKNGGRDQRGQVSQLRQEGNLWHAAAVVRSRDTVP